MIDGMSMSAVLIENGGQFFLEAGVCGSVVTEFVSWLLKLAHSSTSSILLRNQIAACAKYVSLSLPMEDESHDSPRVLDAQKVRDSHVGAARDDGDRQDDRELPGPQICANIRLEPRLEQHCDDRHDEPSGGDPPREPRDLP